MPSLPDASIWSRYNALNRSHTYLSVDHVATQYNYRAFFIDFWNKVVPRLLTGPSYRADANTPRAATSSYKTERAWMWVVSVLCVVLGALLLLLGVKHAMTQRRLTRLRNIHLIGSAESKCYIS